MRMGKVIQQLVAGFHHGPMNPALRGSARPLALLASW
jgi:hypothetical protein